MFERLKRERLLKSIKERLSGKYKVVSLKEQDKVPEIEVILIEYGKKNTSMEAKIDENDQIHLVVKFDHSILYHAITKNYTWFLENVNF